MKSLVSSLVWRCWLFFWKNKWLLVWILTVKTRYPNTEKEQLEVDGSKCSDGCRSKSQNKIIGLFGWIMVRALILSLQGQAME